MFFWPVGSIIPIQPPYDRAVTYWEIRAIRLRVNTRVHILLTDETNLPTEPGAKFFAYGGLFFDIDRLPDLDTAIEKVRHEAGYLPADELKFETNARPPQVSIEQARVAKEQVVQSCLDIGATFVVEVVLNELARNQTHDDLIRFGANEVIALYNAWLRQQGGYGVVVVDRLSSTAEYRYLAEKFCSGLQLQSGESMALDRIKLFASSCSNASHASSAMDIVLGSFRYAINQPRNIEAAKAMMAQVIRLIWHTRVGDQIAMYGYLPRPKTIKSPKYQADYDSLLAWINELIKDME